MTADFADFLAALNSEDVVYVVIEMKATTRSPEKDQPDLIRLREFKRRTSSE